MLLVEKSEKNKREYILDYKPWGIAVYGYNENHTLNMLSSPGKCITSDCHHICLPRNDAERVCACSAGYHFDNASKKCLPKLFDDNFILVSDKAQRKLFQIPIIETNKSEPTLQYSAVEIKAETIAIDPTSKMIYWSEKQPASIKRAALDGSGHVTIASSYANSMVVDPHTGNLFYSDYEKNTIVVTNANGTSSKTIVRPEPSKIDKTSIIMITQDTRNRHIYWTDTFSELRMGQLLRCRYDGSEKEVILDRMHWPGAIAIDYHCVQTEHVTKYIFSYDSYDKDNILYIYDVKICLLTSMKIYVLEKKKRVTYGARLSDLQSKPNPRQEIANKFLGKRFSEEQLWFTDLKIYRGVGFYLDPYAHTPAMRWDFGADFPILTLYGPRKFYVPRGLSIFNTEMFSDQKKSTNDSCKNHACQEICVAISDNTWKCLCNDGKLSAGNECLNNKWSEGIDISPPVPRDCPANIELGLTLCAENLTYTWTVPLWEDDQTSIWNIRIESPKEVSPVSLSPGSHEFSYVATDEHGNVGYCRWTVRVLNSTIPWLYETECRPKDSVTFSTSTTGTESEETGYSTGLIGAIVAIAVFLAVLVIVVYIIKRKRGSPSTPSVSFRR